MSSKWPGVISKLTLEEGNSGVEPLQKKIDWKYNLYLSERASILKEKLQEEGYVLSIRTFNAKESGT